MTARPAVIYIVRRASDGAYKVGWSRFLYRRLVALSARHGACELKHAEPVSGEAVARAEEFAHSRLASSWVEGEWFSANLPTVIHAVRWAIERANLGRDVDCSAIRALRWDSVMAKKYGPSRGSLRNPYRRRAA